MEEYPILEHAPITEALIDIRVKLSADFDVKKIDSMHELIKEHYPEKQEQKMSEIRLEIKEEQSTKSAGVKIYGYRYISSDKKQIVQARLDGFTFSRLHPYIKWEDLRDEAIRLWLIYKDIVSPESIIRVALRYINNLRIPMPIRDFSDYLTAPPLVPEGLPQSVSSFITQVVLYEQSIGANAIITQALELIVPDVAPDVAPIILDIDVFRSQPEGIEEKEAWKLVENLRYFKDRIFFKSITDKLKEIYQ